MSNAPISAEAFLNEAPGGVYAARALHELFAKWCEERGHSSPGEAWFGRRVKAHPRVFARRTAKGIVYSVQRSAA